MIFLRNLHITYSSMCIVRAIKEQEEVRVMTSSFSDKEWAVVLDQPAEFSRSEIKSGLVAWQHNGLPTILQSS